MNDRDQRRFNRLPRIKTFGSDHAADFAPTSKAAALLLQIDQHLTRLEAAKAGQDPDRVSKQSLLDALWLDFKDIARTSRAIALTDNGFDVPYRLPHQDTEKDITTFADSLLELLEGPAAAALRDRFIPYEIEADFVEDLRADREALRQTNTHNHSEVHEGVENTELIDLLLKSAAGIIKELDAIMHNKYKRNPETLRAWKSASHTERNPIHPNPPLA